LREEIAGEFVETGIWRGAACIMMAAQVLEGLYPKL
jgi:hypothetical protein